MKLSDALLLGLISVFGLGAVVAIVVPLMAEVNIAEVEGKYKGPTVQDAVNEHRIRSIQYLNHGLHEAWMAGYGQALIDLGVVSSTQPAKVIIREEQEEDER